MSRRPDRKPPWSGAHAPVEGPSDGVADVSSLKPNHTTAPQFIFGCNVHTTMRKPRDSLALYECCEVHGLARRILPLSISELVVPRFGEATTVLADGRCRRPLTPCTCEAVKSWLDHYQDDQDDDGAQPVRQRCV